MSIDSIAVPYCSLCVYMSAASSPPQAIFEVITSEVTYLRSLDVLIKHFMEDPGMNPNLPEGRRVIDKRQHHVIFSNVREVREVSGRFLEELQSRQRESAVVRNISDIILDYVSH